MPVSQEGLDKKNRQKQYLQWLKKCSTFSLHLACPFQLVFLLNLFSGVHLLYKPKKDAHERNKVSISQH